MTNSRVKTQAFNSSIQEVEARGSVSSRPTWRVPGQKGLHREPILTYSPSSQAKGRWKPKFILSWQHSATFSKRNVFKRLHNLHRWRSYQESLAWQRGGPANTGQVQTCVAFSGHFRKDSKGINQTRKPWGIFTVHTNTAEWCDTHLGIWLLGYVNILGSIGLTSSFIISHFCQDFQVRFWTFSAII